MSYIARLYPNREYYKTPLKLFNELCMELIGLNIISFKSDEDLYNLTKKRIIQFLISRKLNGYVDLDFIETNRGVVIIDLFYNKLIPIQGIIQIKTDKFYDEILGDYYKLIDVNFKNAYMLESDFSSIRFNVSEELIKNCFEVINLEYEQHPDLEKHRNYLLSILSEIYTDEWQKYYKQWLFV